MRRDSTCDDLTKTAKKEFFPGDNESCSLHLATNEKLEIRKDIDALSGRWKSTFFKIASIQAKLAVFFVMTVKSFSKIFIIY